MAKETAIFISFLKKKNLKLTHQREQILRVFLKTERHLSAEGLYNIVKRKDISIGQATVFRTLKLLCEADIAREVELGDKLVRYEHKYGHLHHDHLICVKCGRFIEAVQMQIEKLQDKLCKKLGFLAQRHRLEIFGFCKKCQKRSKNKIKKKRRKAV